MAMGVWWVQTNLNLGKILEIDQENPSARKILKLIQKIWNKNMTALSTSLSCLILTFKVLTAVGLPNPGCHYL
jgi:hypothetical protein